MKTSPGNAAKPNAPTVTNRNQNPSHKSSETEDEPHILPSNTQSLHFSRFIVIESLDKTKQLATLSPFVIEKQIMSILGSPKNVKRMRNGNLLVECRTKTQSENLLKSKSFFTIPIKAYPHSALNSSKGVVKAKELNWCESNEEVKRYLEPQGVTDAYRILTKRKGKLEKTFSYILTFNTPTIPDKILIFFAMMPVEPYIPNPLRCFQCQRFGHHIKNCKHEAVCANCSQKGHVLANCTNEQLCINCQEHHAATSRNCRAWIKEKEIQKTKHLRNITYPEARRIVEEFIPSNKPLYSEVSRPSQKSQGKEPCTTCNIILEELSAHFPNVAESILKKLANAKQAPTPIAGKTTTTAAAEVTNKSGKPGSDGDKNSSSAATAEASKHTGKPVPDVGKPSAPTSVAGVPKQVGTPMPEAGKTVKATTTGWQTTSAPIPLPPTKLSESEKPKKAKKVKTPPLSEEEIKECELKAKQQTRPKLPRFDPQMDVVVGSIPVTANKFARLEDLDAEDKPPLRSTSSQWDPPQSWEDHFDERP